MIENSGQCTAMRHLVLDKTDTDDLENRVKTAYQKYVKNINSSKESIEAAAFAGIFKHAPFEVTEG